MSKKFLNVDGNELSTYRIVEFLLNVRSYLKAGVRKKVAIKLSNNLLGTHLRIARDIWEARYHWLRVNG